MLIEVEGGVCVGEGVEELVNGLSKGASHFVLFDTTEKSFCTIFPFQYRYILLIFWYLISLQLCNTAYFEFYVHCFAFY